MYFHFRPSYKIHGISRRNRPKMVSNDKYTARKLTGENILEDLHDETKGMASKRAEPHKIGHSQHTAPGGKEGEFWHTAEH